MDRKGLTDIKDGNKGTYSISTENLANYTNFKLYPVEGDGNCYFTAITYAIRELLKKLGTTDNPSPILNVSDLRNLWQQYLTSMKHADADDLCVISIENDSLQNKVLIYKSDKTSLDSIVNYEYIDQLGIYLLEGIFNFKTIFLNVDTYSNTFTNWTGDAGHEDIALNEVNIMNVDKPSMELFLKCLRDEEDNEAGIKSYLTNVNGYINNKDYSSPAFYIIVNYTGNNHYHLVGSNDKVYFTYDELPDGLKSIIFKKNQ